MLSSKRFSLDVKIDQDLPCYRFDLKVEITKVSPIKKELILDLFLVEEMRSIVTLDSERLLEVIEHPSGKITASAQIGIEFEIEHLRLAHYQELVIIYDLKRIKIFDLSLERITVTKTFLTMPFTLV